MTNKEIKKKYPGYQIRNSKSSVNKYTLHILYKQKLNDKAIGDYYGECILIINDIEKGRWDYIKKHDKPSAFMWNANDDKFVILTLNLKDKEKNNDGRFTVIPYQCDVNKHVIRFVYERAMGIASGNIKFDLYYPILKKGMYTYMRSSTTKIVVFSYEVPDFNYGNSARLRGLYSIKLSKVIIPAVFGNIIKDENMYLFFFDNSAHYNDYDIAIPSKEILNFNPETKYQFISGLFEKAK